jgi:hypothetical protein
MNTAMRRYGRAAALVLKNVIVLGESVPIHEGQYRPVQLLSWERRETRGGLSWPPRGMTSRQTFT